MSTSNNMLKNRKRRPRRMVWNASLIVVVVVLMDSSAFTQQGDAESDDNTTQMTSLLYQSSITAAEKALRLHELRDARKWLDHAPEKLRGWEWKFLDSQCDESISSLLFDQLNVTALDVSADGRKIAVASAQGDVTLFNLPGFTAPTKIGNHQEAVYSVAFSDDSSRLVTVSRDVTSRVWDVTNGQQISQIKLDNPGVAEACFSPSGKQIATCTWMMTEGPEGRQVHGTVWIWDAETGVVNTKKQVGVKPLDSIHWSSDGTRIVVGSWDGLVHVLDDQANILNTLTVPVDGAYTAVISVAMSNDGKYLAAGSKDRTARVWRADDGELLSTMMGHDGFVNSLKFTADGNRLVTASVDGTCRVWETASGKQLQVLTGHVGSVIAIDLTKSDQQLFSIGRDQQLRTWDLSAAYGGRLAFHVQPEGTYTTTFSPDGQRLYIACYDGHVRVVDSNSGAILSDWIAHDASCNSLSLSHDGKRLLTCSWDKTAKVWNVADQSLLKSLDAQAGIYDCAISPDGTTAAMCVGSKLQIWAIETGQKLGDCEGHGQNLSEVSFSPDGETIATAATGEPARVWKTHAAELIATLGDESHPASTVLYSPYGESIATGHSGMVSVWDSSNHKLQKTIAFGDSPISQLSFSPDNTRIAVASDAVYLLDSQVGASLLRFQPNDDSIYFLAFSPDGLRLATCTAGGSITINETLPLNKRLSSIMNNKGE